MARPVKSSNQPGSRLGGTEPRLGPNPILGCRARNFKKKIVATSNWEKRERERRKKEREKESRLGPSLYFLAKLLLGSSQKNLDLKNLDPNPSLDFRLESRLSSAR